MIDQTESIQFYNSLPQPVLILSSRAGRGNISIAEAIYEYFQPNTPVFHRSIEDFLPPAIVHEDLVRYKFISNHFPFILSAIYTIPFFYYRKLIREKIRTTRIYQLKNFLESYKIKTVICVSHRQAFWTAVLKKNESLDIDIYGVLTEFGNNLGWNYIFWDMMNGFISPIKASELSMGIPDRVPFKQLPLPARSNFSFLAKKKGSPDNCLLIGGYFGQGRILNTLSLLHSHFPDINITVVCGDNKNLEVKLKKRYTNSPKISVHGLVDTIEPIISQCGSVITKPGMATILEAYASQKKIFLFKGMPIAESNNAQYAINHFDAEWFTIPSFSKWYSKIEH